MQAIPQHTPNWPLVLACFGIFMGYQCTQIASAERQRYIYAQNPKYQNEYQRQPASGENPYSNRNQPGPGYITNYNNIHGGNLNNRQPNYQGAGGGGGNQQIYPQREPNMRNGPNPPLYSSAMDRNSNKCKIWIPAESFEKYPWASKIQQDNSNELYMIEICCEGYGPMRWRGNTFCRPLCDNCQNGICIAPGVCQCHEEFVKNDNDDCVFTCPLGCLNGQCYLDGTCQCDPGYKLDETRKFCRPICSAGCGQSERHNCTEPEVCGCSKSYRLTDNGCEPTCEPDCGLGGHCVGPNTCVCDSGTNLKNGVCQDECYQKCDNGICYSRNRCICNPGFTYHEKSTHCVPVRNDGAN